MPRYHFRGDTCRCRSVVAPTCTGAHTELISRHCSQFQDEGQVAGLRFLSEKLKALGVGEETHEPVENLEAHVATTGFSVGQVVYLSSDGPAVNGEILEVSVVCLSSSIS